MKKKQIISYLYYDTATFVLGFHFVTCTSNTLTHTSKIMIPAPCIACYHIDIAEYLVLSTWPNLFPICNTGYAKIHVQSTYYCSNIDQCTEWYVLPKSTKILLTDILIMSGLEMELLCTLLGSILLNTWCLHSFALFVFKVCSVFRLSMLYFLDSQVKCIFNSLLVKWHFVGVGIGSSKIYGCFRNFW